MAIIRGNQDIVGTLIFGAVFERHPDLRVVCVEADAGWAPHYMYRADHAYDRHRNWLTAGELSQPPSEYFRENVYLTFQDDWVAFRVADLMNVERLMWANDFPHSDATWPDSPGAARRTRRTTGTAHARERILHAQRGRPLRHPAPELRRGPPDGRRCLGRGGCLRPRRAGGGATTRSAAVASRRGRLARADRRRGATRVALPRRARRAALARGRRTDNRRCRARIAVCRKRRSGGLGGSSDWPTPATSRVCHRGEVELFRALGVAMQMFGEQPALEFTRVLGTATAAMAEAAVSMFAVSVAEQLRDEGVAPVEYAKRVREATHGLHHCPVRHRFDDAPAVRRGRRPAHGRLGPYRRRRASGRARLHVAFVDLAESTQLTVSTSAGDFAAAIRDFEGHAADAAAQHGARLVKLIGDSAMLAGRDPGHVTDAVVELVQVITADDRFRGAHAGIASGRVVARAGDYLGPPVNLAASPHGGISDRRDPLRRDDGASASGSGRSRRRARRCRDWTATKPCGR